MTTGNKIKLSRLMRKITQKQLGFMVNLTDERIRKYEIDIRTPKEDKTSEIAAALGVSPLFLVNHKTDTPFDVMHVLFEQEILGTASVRKFDDNGKKQYALVFNDHTLNEYLRKWYEAKEHLQNKKNDEIAYRLWQANFPNSMATSPMHDKGKA